MCVGGQQRKPIRWFHSCGANFSDEAGLWPGCNFGIAVLGMVGAKLMSSERFVAQNARGNIWVGKCGAMEIEIEISELFFFSFNKNVE